MDVEDLARRALENGKKPCVAAVAPAKGVRAMVGRQRAAAAHPFARTLSPWLDSVPMPPDQAVDANQEEDVRCGARKATAPRRPSPFDPTAPVHHTRSAFPAAQVAKMNEAIHAHILQGSDAQNANAAADEAHAAQVEAKDEKPAALVNPAVADADANALNHAKGTFVAAAAVRPRCAIGSLRTTLIVLPSLFSLPLSLSLSLFSLSLPHFPLSPEEDDDDGDAGQLEDIEPAGKLSDDDDGGAEPGANMDSHNGDGYGADAAGNDGYGHDEGEEEEDNDEEDANDADADAAADAGADGEDEALEHHDNLARAHGEVADLLGADAAADAAGDEEDSYGDEDADGDEVDVPEHLRGGS